ncbi:MAG TPA: hypothetical protein VK764_05575 [Terracidiphilus sp.]|jgi:hypothetical protein|nr:hypothetical protein [Terracidiphilus sp.]
MNLMGMFLPFMGAFVVLLVLSRLIVSAADEERKALETENGRLEFNPNRRGYWGVYLFIACLGYVVLASFLNGIKSGIAPAFFCAGFIALLLLAFPGSVIVDKNGLGQIYWLRGEKRIAWSDVSKVSLDEKKREVTIVGKFGTKIVHTRQLPDRERLLQELKSHCSEKLPAELKQQLAS